MGIFSSKKKTYVSSVVYNMAGDETKRPNYLKTTIFSAILNRSNMSKAITDSYLHGPGMRFRNFAKWAHRTDYDDKVGLVSAQLMTGNSLDIDTLITQLDVPAGSTALVQSASVGEADYSYWVDQWLLINHPDKVISNYTTDYNNETGVITIIWEDTTTASFTPSDYDSRGKYIYVAYNTVADADETMPEVEGDPVLLDPEDDWPDTTGWTQVNEETVDDTTFTYWERTQYMGHAPDRDATYTLKETMIFADNPVLEERQYRIDTQITYSSIRSPLRVFIYKYLSGNPVLDAMFVQSSTTGSFFPFIPFRIDNKFVSSTHLPDVYDASKKAYKKATTGRYDEMIESLEDNESIDDIDFAYCVFGVSLNVLENASKKYIYRFFEEILNDYSDDGTYSSWRDRWAAADASRAYWGNWRAAQDDPNNPLFGLPEPEQLPYPPAPISEIRITSDRRDVMNYDMTISWIHLNETYGTGSLKSDANPGDVWLSLDRQEDLEERYWYEEEGRWAEVPRFVRSLDEVSINWQVSANTWRKISITGLKHRNLIYNGKSVDITGREAIEDPEESGFIIPLHEGIYRSMGMKDMTQMSTACSFMVLNCYQVVKEKWYQSGWFKIILIVIVVVITIYTGGAGASTAGGILGSNAAVGAAIGLSGTAALVAGAVANAIAAMLLMKVITKAAVAVFGEKWGAIIGAVAGVVALQVGTAIANGQSMASAFSGLMKADNILKLTSAVGEGYSGYVAASMKEIQQETEDVMANYEAESRKIREAWANTFGTDRGIIDPMDITNAFQVTRESVDSFLGRTLMTGSEVAEMSLDLLTEMVDITLSTELPT